MRLPIDNENLIPEEFRCSFRPLVEKIQDFVRVSILKPLAGGFSASVPLLVCATYENTSIYQVFKIGEKDIIEAEVNNWNKFIKNGPYDSCNVIHLKEQHINANHGLIVYNFTGQADKNPTTFDALYEGHQNPEAVLKSLFKDVLKPLSDKIRKERSHLQISEIFRITPSNTKEVTQEVIRLSDSNDICTTPRITPKNGEQLYNPLYFYPFSSSLTPEHNAIPVPMGIVHGDLNAKNILFYEVAGFSGEGVTTTSGTVQIPCLIDYAHTGIKVRYADIAKLESVLKFQLLEVDRVDPNELLEFERENILGGLQPSNILSITDPHLQKLFSCINVLRDFAHRIIGDDYDPLGYWLQLYKNTLLHVKYRDLSEPQKRYAFISAAVILTKYLVSE